MTSSSSGESSSSFSSPFASPSCSSSFSSSSSSSPSFSSSSSLSSSFPLDVLEQRIADVEQEIKFVEEKIKKAELNIELFEGEENENKTNFWREKEKQLREKEKQLREKENQLREKENQLREEKKQLREKENLLIQLELRSSSAMKKRKSLPPPASGNEWTKNTLKQLEISFTAASMEEVLNVGPLTTAATTTTMQPTSMAESLIRDCAFIEPNTSLLLMSYDEAERKALQSTVPVPSVGLGWTLFKYLRLLHGLEFMELESVVDDFVMHLLAALGFNDGPLLVLSRNTLKFTMGGSRVSAIADVTVYHISHRFRLAVFEDKKYRSLPIEIDNAEAQLVAEAIAAVQANMQQANKEADKSKRSKSEADAASVSASSLSVLPSSCLDDSGRIFLVRVVGSSFTFYSTRLTSSFIAIIKDYKQAGPELPSTVVYRLTVDVPRINDAVSSPSSSSSVFINKDEFSFGINEDRIIIIRFLDSLRQIMCQ